MVTDTPDKVRCEWCGTEGVYGIDIVDTDWYDPESELETIKVFCKDVEACFDRKTKGG